MTKLWSQPRQRARRPACASSTWNTRPQCVHAACRFAMLASRFAHTAGEERLAL
jgi:hypothetical protein